MSIEKSLFKEIFLLTLKSVWYIFILDMEEKENKKLLKYKFDVGDALKRVGFNTYKAKTSGLLSQDTLKKIKNEDTNITLKSLNNLCLILDMEPKDILKYEETKEEKEMKYNSQKW